MSAVTWTTWAATVFAWLVAIAAVIGWRKQIEMTQRANAAANRAIASANKALAMLQQRDQAEWS